MSNADFSGLRRTLLAEPALHVVRSRRLCPSRRPAQRPCPAPASEPVGLCPDNEPGLAPNLLQHGDAVVDNREPVADFDAIQYVGHKGNFQPRGRLMAIRVGGVSDGLRRVDGL